jgi:hypothetical protein
MVAGNQTGESRLAFCSCGGGLFSSIGPTWCLYEAMKVFCWIFLVGDNLFSKENTKIS